MPEIRQISYCLLILDTLGTLARTVEPQQFAPLAVESIKLGLVLIENKDDADLRRSVYSLFASVSTVMKQDMKELLPGVMQILMKSLKSNDELNTSVSKTKVFIKVTP